MMDFVNHVAVGSMTANSIEYLVNACIRLISTSENFLIAIMDFGNYRMFFRTSIPMARAISGGTAFPTSVNCGTSVFRFSPPVDLFP